jgi:hypothetical protein
VNTIDFKKDFRRLHLSDAVLEVLGGAADLCVPETRENLLDWALGRKAGTTDWSPGNREDKGQFFVAYDVPDVGPVVEASVVKARNGVSVNYPDPAMRRRDPDAMVIGDERPTDKPTYVQRFGEPFAATRRQTLDWLKTQQLIALPFYAGPDRLGYGSLMICPLNAGFFAAAMADLQGMVPNSQVPADFAMRGGVLFVAPPFRHSHFDGRQIVVHNRRDDHQEVFAYNLYPGPSAKKGVYSILLDIGEREGWVTNHCSVVEVQTPYDNQFVLMHEGASGGGKSEMVEPIERQEDGRLLLGVNKVTGERRVIRLPEACQIFPMCDDMGVAHPSDMGDSPRLQIDDAEAGWFIRVNHIDKYGTNPQLEKLSIQPPQPLVFLNHHVVPGGQALIWEHAEDAPGKPNSNPRLILPRHIVRNVKTGPASVAVRSFGVRCPPTFKGSPQYGILGILHILPPALAWLWRLVAPRGFGNPSIQDSSGMQSEGVGSYWAFCTGRRVDQANLLLQQVLKTPETRYVLIANQHVGAWDVGFMGEWLAREYLARRGGARFRPDQLVATRCNLLGWVPFQMQVEGTLIPRWFLDVTTQPEVDDETYEHGATMLREFFERELRQFDHPDLDPVGRSILQAFLDGATQDDYLALIPHRIYAD